MNILEVENLNIRDVRTGNVIIYNSSFNLQEGSCLAIVGESGSGKSVTCKSIMRLNNPSLRQSGDIFLNGENINQLSEKEMRRIRGRNLCMILQNGMSAFNPSCVIGQHMKETLSQHFGWNQNEIEAKMNNAMESVMLKNPTEIMNKYPHQLSGGMLQRLMIALAFVLEPDIIIADEPTTALDTISQFEVVEQFINLRERMGCSMIFVSHDLGVVKRIADYVLVMKDGKIIERGNIRTIFSDAQHEYTKYLISTKEELSNHFKKMMGRSNLAEN
ncbi:peptide ABC transporter ATP-binding protein [Bacillus sp. SA1-12]|uniref:staphylopine uptake ABC transporter ATP-binding protein CntD n=1 Tax=Bacillus sp. SA1-12 TaxID=1455638 RepID=UPI00062722F4|nr:ABC transporter ATP-binding protein [Bacillus sp. SA1-12]KKI90173.1 peptide ABC transporter ATP-binding protein [Bacillus sp. SA1-12]